jgi:hypothetical protein
MPSAGAAEAHAAAVSSRAARVKSPGLERRQRPRPDLAGRLHSRHTARPPLAPPPPVLNGHAASLPPY